MAAVSVIVPVYNVEPYVARCAHSLFGQTLEDIEYIFVDDCSPDRSIDVIKEVLADYPGRKEQVHFVRTPRNGGLVKARLLGYQKATGDYVIHCDSDDAIVPDAYRLMYEKAVAEDLDVVTCDFSAFVGTSSWVQSQYSAPGNEIADILSWKVWPNVWSHMFRRHLWDDIIVPVADMMEDMVFTVQTIAKAKRIGYIPMPLYLYYIRSGSLSSGKGKRGSIKQWYSQVANAKLILEYLSHVNPVTWSPSDVILFKYRCRLALKNYVQIPQFYHRWRNTFPEVNWAYFWTKGISSQAKINHCLVLFRLYHPYRHIRRLLRKVYYRVFFNCEPPV